jgi:hypothetical protein
MYLRERERAFCCVMVYRHYGGESVNRSQMDVKRKTCDTQTWEKTFISRHILHQLC